MNQVMFLPRHLLCRRTIILTGLCTLLLWLGAAASTLLAEGTNAAPANPPATTGEGDDFGQYLVSHQQDLTPFFQKHGDEIFGQAIPLFLGLLGRIMLVSLVAGLAIDVLLSRCFSAFFAPIYAKLKRAFIYAVGQSIVRVAFTIVIGVVVISSASFFHSLTIAMAFGGLLVVVELAVQTGWVIYLYRTAPLISAGFYLIVFIAHAVTSILVSAPFLGSRATDLVTNFVDQAITSKLETEIKARQQEMATMGAARDEVKAKSTDAQSRLSQAQADQQQLQKEIEEKKNSETYIFSQIMKVHARGDLTAAHNQLTDYLLKFPAGTMTAAARSQLTQVDGEIAVQDAQKKQAEADAAAAVAAARTDLLARAAKGEVTLSEMRGALFGKTPADVSALFGAPAETASNRWGYSQRMVFNPLTNEKFGLTVNFSAGIVQGVDYYYGSGGKK